MLLFVLWIDRTCRVQSRAFGVALNKFHLLLPSGLFLKTRCCLWHCFLRLREGKINMEHINEVFKVEKQSAIDMDLFLFSFFPFPFQVWLRRNTHTILIYVMHTEKSDHAYSSEARKIKHCLIFIASFCSYRRALTACLSQMLLF